MNGGCWVGVIRVVTLADPEKVALHGRILEQHVPGLRTHSVCLDGYPEGLYTETLLEEAGPQVAAKARELAEAGASAVVISCAGDPGLELARSVVGVPVLGAGSAACGVALGLSARVGVLGLNAEVPRAVREALRDRLVAQAWPEGVVHTLDLATPAGQRAALAAAGSLEAAGVGAIVLTCTGYATIGLARRLRPFIGVPVVDPLEAVGLLLRYLGFGDVRNDGSGPVPAEPAE